MHDWIVGMDVSSLVEVEDCGGKFYDNGIEGDALSILKAHGANMVRLRLWNDPYDAEGNSYSAGYSDIKTVLKLAKRLSLDLTGFLICITVIVGRIRANRQFRKPGRV